MSIATGFLNVVEKVGNRLPDPVFIFLIFILGLVGASVWAEAQGLTVVNPVTGAEMAAQSLLSGENLRRLFIDMPKTLTGFAPLGYVLVVMLGAGVAERTGLFSASMRQAVKGAPVKYLTPLMVFVAIVANHAADAAYVVLIPIAGALYAAAGRHPVAGIAAAFAGVSGGFSANIFPGHLDALLLGITEPAARLLDPTWTMNIAGNWWFILAMTFVFVPVGWWVTDKIIEPRLGKFTPSASAPIDLSATELDKHERRGLFFALIGLLLVVGLWVWLTVGPNPPFIDAGAPTPEARMTPFYQSLVAGFFVLFLITGVFYGIGAKTVRNHRDIVKMTADSMAAMGPYIVLAFVAAHFVAMFNWSNLGAIIAINGAEALQAMRDQGLGAPVLLAGIVVIGALINLVIGSASAKWAALAPILVPMLMLLGISPEMTTAAYRMGDSVTNIITPLMVYFPLVLTFCQRWDPEFGLGSLMATMIPYSMAFLVVGVTMTALWVAFALPLGPGATLHYDLPKPAEAVQAIDTTPVPSPDPGPAPAVQVAPTEPAPVAK